MSEQAGNVRPNPCGSKACRRLFGPVDSEQLSRDCEALMAGCIQEARERWNFDFVTETPLEGDFAWERVRGLGLPKLYLPTGPRRGRDELGGGRRPGTSPALLQGTAEEDHVDLSLSCTLVPRSGEQPEESPGGPGESQGRKRRQTSMTGTEFLPLQTPADLLQEEALISPQEACSPGSARTSKALSTSSALVFEVCVS
ncbi:PREDICTED: cyclin-dependent kinase inhibitor 1 isoform X1 [Colobus angolensis palliatus]|uniref:cyclin-dependent kinase inhibitor 1 isoform X1 n=1 Tax=Colobus angolensis palliatus TaxID=336983 RepID=UPI0005F4A7BB|nr:PREDICTED: cyclin-dependent kinase inhibitor 1 isoform X1 [Colobus angolensis palliatus]